jgi:glycosyltransferase involved in cell wall biosynthesis
MEFQARLEAKHARRADLVITISRYCAGRLEELYGVENAVVVPELIDLDAWRHLFRSNPAPANQNKFTVLSVCRLYPRKRIEVLVQSALLLRDAIPELEIRIVGDGPELPRLKQIWTDLGVEENVTWLGDLARSALAQEYNRADVFCLPSVQEGFGIVFLEAMAAGKPVVAARAAAIPEVVRSGILVEPDSPEAIADGILRLYRDPVLRHSLASGGLRDVEEFDVNRVVRSFVSELAAIAPAFKALNSPQTSEDNNEPLNCPQPLALG